MGVGICLTDNPHSLQWSPFQENLLVVATSNRPGHSPISGILYFLEFLPKNEIEIKHQVQLNLGTDQVIWSHMNKNIVLTSCDDYMLRFFDLKNINCFYREFYENQKVRRLDWDRISLEWILSAGSNENVKLYNTLQEEDESIQIIKHDSNVHDAEWNPNTPYCLTCKFYLIFIFSACDKNGFVYLWDIRQKDPAMKFKIDKDTCGMKLDINIFDENSLALGCFDQTIQTFDLRNVKKPKGYLKDSHASLITNIKWSPHTQHILATSSTDRTMRIWDMRPTNLNQNKESYGGGISSFKSQKMEDWVNSLDWNPHEVGLIALCCNDHLTKAYNVRED